jgi:hypothetical protein
MPSIDRVRNSGPAPFAASLPWWLYGLWIDRTGRFGQVGLAALSADLLDLLADRLDRAESVGLADRIGLIEQSHKRLQGTIR